VQSSDAGTRENYEIAISNKKSLDVVHAEMNAPSTIAVLHASQPKLYEVLKEASNFCSNVRRARSESRPNTFWRAELSSKRQMMPLSSTSIRSFANARNEAQRSGIFEKKESSVVIREY